MKIVKASYLIECPEEPLEMLKRIERAARVCYKSEDKITDTSYADMIRRLIKSGHESVLEHGIMSVKSITDRGVSHEIVRHRIASYSQESTRFCSYDKDKFGHEITVIDLEQHLKNPLSLSVWTKAMRNAEMAYFEMLALGESPQIARSVLPNSLKTEIVKTYNLREWRLFFKQRTAPQAHPQMRELTIPLLQDFKDLIPVVFDDIGPNKKENEHVCKLGKWYAFSTLSAFLKCVECDKVIAESFCCPTANYVELNKIEIPWE